MVDGCRAVPTARSHACAAARPSALCFPSRELPLPLPLHPCALQAAPQTTGLWKRLASAKPIVTEPRGGGPEALAEVMKSYYDGVAAGKGGLFMAVCRGKASLGSSGAGVEWEVERWDHGIRSCPLLRAQRGKASLGAVHLVLHAVVIPPPPHTQICRCRRAWTLRTPTLALSLL